jgi:two-component system heavy metal sensor histidine kinase CusS
MSRLKIRWKLTLWYGGVLALVLALFGTVVYAMMRHDLLERIDQGLNEELADVLSEVKRAKTSAGMMDWLNRRFADHAGFDFQITRPSGERFFYNPRLAEKAWPMPTRDAESLTPLFQTLPVEKKGNWRIVHVTAAGPDGRLTVQVGRGLAAFEHEMTELLLTFLLAGPLTLLAAVGGGYFLACRVLRPVQEMTQAANVISADQLNKRIAVTNPHDELGELAQTLNDMIERLERSFTEMQRFTTDAAHELRTPLAIIRSEAEVALRLPRSGEQYCGVLENLLEEINRLSLMADQLLFLARHDTGLSPKIRDNVLLDDLLREVVGNMQLVAQQKGIALELSENAPCTLYSDRSLLRRVFINLLDNAIKYTDEGGRASVASQASLVGVTIRVRDTGRGIPAEHLSHIFDRFYRVDAARSGDDNSAGLGLSLCQSIVRGLGGNIRVESTLGEGSLFTLTLPTP